MAISAFQFEIALRGRAAQLSSWQPGKLAARLQAAAWSKKTILLRLDMGGGAILGGVAPFW
jgi:hypothetical protein